MLRRVRTKICGIGTIDDLNTAIDAGADAIGLIVGTTHVTEDELCDLSLLNLSAPFSRRIR